MNWTGTARIMTTAYQSRRTPACAAGATPSWFATSSRCGQVGLGVGWERRVVDHTSGVLNLPQS